MRQRYVSFFFVFFALFITIPGVAGGPGVSSPANVIRSQILDNFNAFPQSTEEQRLQTLGELLVPNSQTDFTYPPFPRTWLELSLENFVETSTTASFDTGKLSWAIETLAAPYAVTASLARNAVGMLGTAIKAVRPGMTVSGVGYSAEATVSYGYSYKSTFMAMTSLKQIRPQAKQNVVNPIKIPEKSEPEAFLRPLLKWNPSTKRTTFNVSTEYPVLGMCKYELTMTMGETNQNTISFVFGNRNELTKNIVTTTYAVFSNFFLIEGDVPVQDYLRTKCAEVFTEAVRFVAEPDFNNVILETFAHYHPQAQCDWAPEQTQDPRGDASCMDWFRNPRHVMGSYRRVTVPRCVLGNQGIPVCTLKSIQGTQCPIYEYQGHLTERRPIDGGRQLNPTSARLFACDKGLSCVPSGGTDPLYYNIGDNFLEKTWTRMTGVTASCRAGNGR